MQDLRQYGVAVMTATEVVDDFALAQGNMRTQNMFQMLRHLKWSWKELFRETLWEIKKAVLPVDCHNHTIHLPADCERVINISVVDCYGKIHPLGFNTDHNTAQIRCLKSNCSCSSCDGEDTLCAAIDSIQVVTETVVINGTDYTKTILTRHNGAGDIQTQTTTPTWDVGSGSVVNNVVVETVCNVETTNKGCIKVTRPNMDALRLYCGCGNFFNEWDNLGYKWGNARAYRELIPPAYNYWGEWNFNAVDQQIIHIFGFGSQRNHFNHSDSEEQEWRNNIRQVILSYQTNGETPGIEILIPEYAVQAVQVGMVYMQKQLHPKISGGEKRDAKYAFNAEKKKVFAYLNPIRMDDLSKQQTTLRRW